MGDATEEGEEAADDEPEGGLNVPLLLTLPPALGKNEDGLKLPLARADSTPPNNVARPGLELLRPRRARLRMSLSGMVRPPPPPPPLFP